MMSVTRVVAPAETPALVFGMKPTCDVLQPVVEAFVPNDDATLVPAAVEFWALVELHVAGPPVKPIELEGILAVRAFPEVGRTLEEAPVVVEKFGPGEVIKVIAAGDD